jgi:hypothetical protein
MDTNNIPKAVWIPVLAALTLGVAWMVTHPPPYNNTRAREAAAAATLKSGIFPAEVQCKEDVVLDQDGNGIGEYGLLSEITGRRAVNVPGLDKLKKMPGPLAQGEVAYSYRFAAYLPDGKGGAITEPTEEGPRKPLGNDAAKGQEQHFVVYAWPNEPNMCKRMLAITETGQVLFAPWEGQPPEWNAVFGGKGWGSELAWKPFLK